MSVASSSELKRVLDSWEDHPADVLVVSMQASAAELGTAVSAIREVTPAGLVFITERIEERTIIDILDDGADIVLTKPVSAQLLAAQALVVARRSSNLPSFVIPNMELERISLDTSTRTVTSEGQEPRRLTQLEFRLLYVLMTNRGLVVPTEVLVERVWGYAGEGDRELVRGLVSRLRDKIDVDSEGESFIETIPGVGYRFPAEDL